MDCGEVAAFGYSLSALRCFRREDAGDEVVVVGLGDEGAVEAAGLEGIERAEVVDEDFAVDFGGVELGAAFPEERGFGAGAFGEEGELAADPLLLAICGRWTAEAA